MVWIGLHGVMFLFLFSDFYKQNYIEKQKRLNDAKKSSANGKVHFNDDSNSSQVVGRKWQDEEFVCTDIIDEKCFESAKTMNYDVRWSN